MTLSPDALERLRVSNIELGKEIDALKERLPKEVASLVSDALNANFACGEWDDGDDEPYDAVFSRSLRAQLALLAEVQRGREAIEGRVAKMEQTLEAKELDAVLALVQDTVNLSGWQGYHRAIVTARAELTRLRAEVETLRGAIASINPFDNQGEPNEFFCLWCQHSHDRYKITPAHVTSDEHPDLHTADCIWRKARLAAMSGAVNEPAQ